MIGVGEGHRFSQKLGFGPRQAHFQSHAAFEAGLGEQQIATRGAATQAEIARSRAELVEPAADLLGHRVDLLRRETGRLGLAGTAIAGIVDHVAAEDDGVLGFDLLGPASEPVVELLLGTIDDLRGLGHDVGAEPQYAQEIELLA